MGSAYLGPVYGKCRYEGFAKDACKFAVFLQSESLSSSG